MSELAAEYVTPDSLKGWARNPRKNDHVVDEVAASIARFGFASPIIARRDTREVIAGHTRLKAAHKLGLERVPVRFMELSEREAHLLALADNRLSERAEWHEADLLSLLSDFGSDEVALAGWSADDLEQMATNLLKGAPSGDEDDGEGELVELPREPTTREGDRWQLGRHVLHCARGESIAGSYGLVCTDPPYGISVVKRGMVGADFGVAKKGRYEPIAGDDETPDVRWLLERAPVCIVWGGNYFADQLPPTGGWLVWDKRGDSGIENTFADCELAWSNRTGPARVHRQLWNGMIREGEHEPRQHPTQKPVALLSWCLGFAEGDVFDAYAGSGSTLLAAERLGRTCTAVELSPAYCDVIIERWQRMTGGKVTRT